MTNNTEYYTQDDKDTVPASESVTGTIETVGRKVLGTDTLFTQEFQTFDFLYVDAEDEFQQIVNILSDTEMSLKNPFTSDIAATGVPLKVKRFQATKIEIDNVGGGTSTINGQNILTGKKVTFDKQPYGSSRGISDFLDPILLDATASDCQVTIQH